LTIPVFEAGLVDVFGINARCEVQNRRFKATLLRLVSYQKGRSAVRADRIPDLCVHGVVDETAGRANLDREHQSSAARVSPYEVASTPVEKIPDRGCTYYLNRGNILVPCHVFPV
jgi:hypothetical protein